MVSSLRVAAVAAAFTALSCSSDTGDADATGGAGGSASDPTPSASATAGSDSGATDSAGGSESAAPDGEAPTAICVACEDSCETPVPVEMSGHVEGDLDYDDVPPAGGDHNGCWADWGIHATAVRPENWVHNLEHGGVIFLYDCADGCEAEVAELGALVESRPQAMLTPYPGLGSRFAVVAWGHRLVSDCFDATAMAAFLEAHIDQGPESITSGAPRGCM